MATMMQLRMNVTKKWQRDVPIDEMQRMQRKMWHSHVFGVALSLKLYTLLLVSPRHRKNQHGPSPRSVPGEERRRRPEGVEKRGNHTFCRFFNVLQGTRAFRHGDLVRMGK